MNALLDGVVASPLAQRIGWALVHFLWQGAAAAVLLAAILRLLRRRSPQARWLAACVMLAVMAALPVATACLVRVDIRSRPAAQADHLEIAASGAVEPVPFNAQPAEFSSAPATAAPVARTSAAPAVQAASPASPSWQERADQLLRPALPWVVLAWLAGVVLLSTWHLGGWTHLRHLTRRDAAPLHSELLDHFNALRARLRISRPVRLLRSARAAVPMVVGFLRPAVLLPASALTGLTPEQLTAVLAHELAHIRRHDCLIRALQALIETLLFYHPAVWWVSSRIRAESEHCCDEIALGVCGDRHAYAAALLKVVELGRADPSLAAAATGGELVTRIRRILGVSAEGPARRAHWVLGAVLLAAALLAGLAACRGDLGAKANPSTNSAPAAAPSIEGSFVGRWETSTFSPPGKADVDRAVLVVMPGGECAMVTYNDRAPYRTQGPLPFGKLKVLPDGTVEVFQDPFTTARMVGGKLMMTMGRITAEFLPAAVVAGVERAAIAGPVNFGRPQQVGLNLLHPPVEPRREPFNVLSAGQLTFERTGDQILARLAVRLVSWPKATYVSELKLTANGKVLASDQAVLEASGIILGEPGVSERTLVYALSPIDEPSAPAFWVLTLRRVSPESTSAPATLPPAGRGEGEAVRESAQVPPNGKAVFFLHGEKVRMQSGDKVLDAQTLVLDLSLPDGRIKHVEVDSHQGRVRMQVDGSVLEGARIELNDDGTAVALGGVVAGIANALEAGSRPASPSSRPAVHGAEKQAFEEAQRAELRQAAARRSAAAEYDLARQQYLELALPQPELRDARAASKLFEARQDWPTLADAYEAQAEIMWRVTHTPLEAFTRPVSQDANDPGRSDGLERGPTVMVQTQLDGEWSRCKGTAESWMDWLQRRQDDLRMERIKVLRKLAELCLTQLQAPPRAVAALQTAGRGVPLQEESVEELAAQMWPKIKVQARDVVAFKNAEMEKATHTPQEREQFVSQTAAIRLEVLEDLAKAQVAAGDLRGAASTRLRGMLAGMLMVASGDWNAHYPMQEAEEFWRLIRRLGPSEPLPPMLWLHVLDREHAELAFPRPQEGPHGYPISFPGPSVVIRPGQRVRTLTVSAECTAGEGWIRCYSASERPVLDLGRLNWGHGDPAAGTQTKTFDVPENIGIIRLSIEKAVGASEFKVRDLRVKADFAETASQPAAAATSPATQVGEHRQPGWDQEGRQDRNQVEWYNRERAARRG